MKNILIALCVLSAAISFNSCQKNANGDSVVTNGAVYTNKDTLTGALVLPTKIDTVFSGNISGWYDESANAFTYTVAWYNLWKTTSPDTLTGIKFYGSASATDTGTLARTIYIVNNTATSSLSLSSISGGNSLTTIEKTDFLKGNWYIVLCSKKYPMGIIRGKLNPVKR